MAWSPDCPSPSIVMTCLPATSATGTEQEQAALTRLQAEDLRREDRLRHWSLRVHHVSDAMKLAFELAAR